MEITTIHFEESSRLLQIISDILLKTLKGLREEHEIIIPRHKWRG